MKIKIVIDMTQLAKAQKTKKFKNMTLQGAYGHELQHVINDIAIINSNTGNGSILDKSEQQEYDTVEQATAAAATDLAEATAQMAEEMDAEAKHKGANSPTAYEPYDPIGEMPGNPANKGGPPIEVD